MNIHSLETYNFPVDPSLIARRPLKVRDNARLMVIDRASGEIRHSVFKDLPHWLTPQTTVVMNDSRVIPARLIGRKKRGSARIEIFVLRPLPQENGWEVLLKPARRLSDGDFVVFDGSDLEAEVVSRSRRIVRFNREDILPELERIGHMPLPPYIDRPDDIEDREDYQTVYARHYGSVAAPTAGLHFTPELSQTLVSGGHDIRRVTLHVNYGTFQPVEEDDIRRHAMHTERYSVNQEDYDAILCARDKGRSVTAVGTTSLRVLESVAVTGVLDGETSLFVYPGFSFRVVGHLITNFHMPGSTLLMLVSAFAGVDLMRRAYCEAMEKRYRLFSYGDAMLIL